MSDLRFAMLGTGFWARYQLAGWQEIPGAQCVALYNRTRSKAEKLAEEFGVPSVYDNIEELLDGESLDFIDIVTDVDSHAQFVELAIDRGLPVICQKPMAPTLETATRMVARARESGTPLLIHENWRWQKPLRRLKEILDSGRLGRLVRARIDYANSFPVFDSQPFLKDLEQFLLTDIGTHILDVARFLFGEAREVYCQTRRLRQDIAGEDVATVLLGMRDGLTVTCNMSYASRWEFDRFPQTMVAVEGTNSGLSLGMEYELTVFDSDGKHPEMVPPQEYAWADPAYLLIHSSIVECHCNLLGSLRGECEAETTGEDNLRTLELVFAAYESAETKTVVEIA
jgi:predicted dehydrogenase